MPNVIDEYEALCESERAKKDEARKRTVARLAEIWPKVKACQDGTCDCKHGCKK